MNTREQQKTAKEIIDRARKLLDGGYKGGAKSALETIVGLTPEKMNPNHFGYYQNALKTAENTQ